MDKVLVVKAIEPNYNTVSGGPPVMMVGGGGRRSRDGPAVGRTKRERLGGLAGGLVGVAGALTGQHRSLGGLVQSMISGGAQGKALGGALGRSKLVGVGRQRQARADYDEEARRDYARMSAEGRFENRLYDVNDRINPATMRRRVTEVNQEDELAAQQAKEAQARAKAQAAAEGTQFGAENRNFAQTHRDLRESFMAAGVREEDLNEAFNLFNQAVRNQQGGSVRVDPQQPNTNDPTQGGTVAVQADGTRLAPTKVAVQSTVNAPNSSSASANKEISQDETVAQQELVKLGTNHTGEYGGRLALPGSGQTGQEEEESLESIQRRGAEQPVEQPAGNQQSTVGVVDSMRPSLEQIQREQQGGN